ncbi:MAG: ABC transporter permease [Clostridia bacterium]|nr:ABC transporter permease [Clostridia bacterium]
MDRKHAGGFPLAIPCGAAVIGAAALLFRWIVRDSWSAWIGALIMRWYWPLAGLAVLAWIAAVLLYRRGRHLERPSFLHTLFEETARYRYLISRLVSRDFQNKYRQSILGVLWSFINPLLTMVVQYFVFSTLFHPQIENFPVYLMTGIIFFNFFTEGTTLSLQSITTNAALIKKVYMPRIIYPLSRVLFALLNVSITLIPLFLMILITGLPLTKAALLLPFPLICLTVFILGVGMILAALNVMFRDTAFLWGIVTLLWSYLTPLFYPEEIIPAAWIHVYHVNPMYQFIYFIRCLLLDGVTPQPQTYLWCILCAGVPFALGLWFFHRRQDSFIYYL